MIDSANALLCRSFGPRRPRAPNALMNAVTPLLMGESYAKGRIPR